MAPGTIVERVGLLIQEASPAASGLPWLRVTVRILIGALIVLLLTYVVIEQVGTWSRRRSGRG
jgi:hypothetical protein